MARRGSHIENSGNGVCYCDGCLPSIPAYTVDAMPPIILMRIARKLDITNETDPRGYTTFASSLGFNQGDIWTMALPKGSITMQIFKECSNRGITLDVIQRTLHKMQVEAANIIPENLNFIEDFMNGRRFHRRRANSPIQHTESCGNGPCDCGRYLSSIAEYDMSDMPPTILQQIARKLDISDETDAHGYAAFASHLGFNQGDLWSMMSTDSVTMAIFKACPSRGIKLDMIQQTLEKLNVEAANIIPENLSFITERINERVNTELLYSRHMSPVQHTESSSGYPTVSSTFPHYQYIGNEMSYPPPHWNGRFHHEQQMLFNIPPYQYYNHWDQLRFNPDPRTARSVDDPHQTISKEYASTIDPHQTMSKGYAWNIDPNQTISKEYARSGVPRIVDSSDVVSSRSLRCENDPSSDDDRRVSLDSKPSQPRRKRKKSDIRLFITGGNCAEEMREIKAALSPCFSDKCSGLQLVWDSGLSVEDEAWQTDFNRAHYVVIVVTKLYVIAIKQRSKCRPVKIHAAVKQELYDRRDQNKRFLTVIYTDKGIQPHQVPTDMKVASYLWPQEKDKLLLHIQESAKTQRR